MITYKDKPLLLLDPGHKLQRWLEDHLPIEDLSLFSWVHSQSGSASSRWQTPRLGEAVRGPLAAYNWPAPPRIRLNTLYVPTGATRWSVGLFLVDGQTLAEVGADPTAGTLVLEDDGAGILYEMYMLEPRPINYHTGTGGNKDAYLLPLVDERYFTRLYQKTPLRITSETRWLDVLEHYQPCEQVSLGVSYPGELGFPHPQEFYRPGEPSAVVFEAAAAACGMRLVPRRFGYALKVPNLDEFDGHTASLERVMCGGVFDRAFRAACLPNKVVVSFPVFRMGLTPDDDRVWTVSVASADDQDAQNIVGTGLGAKVMSSTALADADVTSSTPYPLGPFRDGQSRVINQEELTGLARRLAADYYSWSSRGCDVCVAGVSTWEFTGFEDYVLYEVGSQGAKLEQPLWLGQGNYHFQTRIVSLPTNCYPTSFQHYFPRKAATRSVSDPGWLEDDSYWGQMDDDVASGKMQYVSLGLRRPSDTAAVDTSRKVLAADPLLSTGHWLTKGTPVMVRRSWDSQIWEIQRALGTDLVWGVLEQDLYQQRYARMNIWWRDPDAADGKAHATGKKVNVHDAWLLPSESHALFTGARVGALYLPNENRYIAIGPAPPNEYYAKIYSGGDLEPDGSTMAQIYRRWTTTYDSSGRRSTSFSPRAIGEPFQVYDMLLHTGEVLKEGMEVVVRYFALDGVWSVVQARWPEYWGKLYTQLSYRSSAQVVIKRLGGTTLVSRPYGGAQHDVQVEAWDVFLQKSTDKLESNTRVALRWDSIDERFNVVGAACGKEESS